ncbi:MAG: PepSY-like domain-containing protein, partial [Planctomycetota bacterium]
MNKMMKLFVLACVCVTALSGIVCALEGASISALPAAVQEVVKREFSGQRITEIDDEDDYDGIDVYKIEAETAEGKDLMIKVAPDGTLYQKEVEIDYADVPKVVQALFEKELGDVSSDVDEVKRISKQGKIQYNIELKMGRNDVELKIAADGTLLEKDIEEDEDDDDEDGDDDAQEATTDKPGLIGAQFGSLEFERVQSVVPMSSLEVKS